MRAATSLGFVLFFALPSAHAYKVDFSPKGEEKQVRQARAVFSEAMVPFGDPRGKVPFKVSCTIQGKGLWEDPRTWIYEFEKELPAGQRCSFEGSAELKSQAGKAWEGERNFTLSTGAPAVTRTNPYDGSESIEEEQAFVLTLDGAVDPASIEKAVYFLVEGLPERIPAKALAPALREQVLKSVRRGYYDEEEEGAKEPAPAVVIQPSRPLPPNKKVQLVWGKGIRSVSGVSSSREQLFAFKVREPFTVTLNCTRENADAPCLPIGTLGLNFSGAIAKADAAKVSLSAGGKSQFAKLRDHEQVSSIEFPGPFAPNTEYTVQLPANLRDEAGRPLTNAAKFPLKVKTGGYPPLAKFAAPFGVIEAKDAVLPVTLRNVEASLPGSRIVGNSVKIDDRNPAVLLNWVRRVKQRHDSYYDWENGESTDRRGDSLLKGTEEKGWTLPKPSGREPFEVVGIPLKEKGLHVVELESQLLGKSLLGKPRPMYVAAAALVTDLGVHFKWGRENSLVFVTSLDSAKPVGGAAVRIVDCSGSEVWKGKTESDGVARVEGIPALHEAKYCEGIGKQLTAIARKGDDFSLTSSDWDNGIEPWRFQVNFSPDSEENIAHTAFDRTLLRAGQTVHMKHYLRLGFLRGLRAAKSYPRNVVLQHASGQRVVFPLKFDANGMAETEWKIPEAAKLGTYEVYLTSQEIKPAAPAGSHAANLTPDSEAPPVAEDDSLSFYGKGNFRTGDIRVEEFRLPVLTGSLQFPKGPLVAAKELFADLNVRYLNGGGASNLPVTFRARINDNPGISLPEFEGFSFANGGVILGRQNRAARNTELELKIPSLKLDEGGNARVPVKDLPARNLPFNLQLEAEYRDPNGAVQTVSRGIQVMPSDLLVGVKTDGWLASQDKVKFQVAVVSPDGKPRQGETVKVTWVESKSYSHRKRLVGGFYAYENYEELKAMGEACRGTTNAKGLFLCEGKAPASGNLILLAEAGAAGKPALARGNIWVAGEEDSWFPAENNDRVDILPERKNYEPGEKARFQIRMPYREATALVTVEREGILEHFVQEVSAKNPVLEVPVRGGYAPNVFVSALLLRGRVGEPRATALVDLAKPSYKLGIAEVKVGWRAHELKVSLETDREEFKVREKARVKVKVVRAEGGGAATQGEVLLVAVDEALLQLRSNDSWNLLDAMMGERPLRVATSTVQGQIIGKRHYGLKALPAGGGGGVSSARELFDTLLFWKATIPLDGNGEATAEVPMNDSLSSFRIVAVATEGATRFGTGQKSVRTRQDLMLFAGVSPYAREGDRARAEVTVRNGGEAPLEAEVKGRVADQALKAQTVKLAAGASQNVHWDLDIPKGTTSLGYEFEASAGSARDQLKFTQKVEPPYVPTVLQATLERVNKALTLDAALPKDAFPGTASLEVRLETKLGSNLAGVKAYMQAYPYQCLEQKVSKAVSAQDKKAWEAIARTFPQYVDSRGLLKYFPEMGEGSEVLTSYILSVADAGGYAVPASILPTLLEGLKKFVEGKSYSSGFIYPAADLSLRKLSAMDTLSRYHVFDPAWLGTIQLDPSILPLSALVDYRGILAREENVPKGKEALAKVDQAIRARIAFRGTILGFKNETADDLWWLMGSVDSSAVKLLSAVAEDKSWANDMGRLVRGALARQKNGRWDLTTANAWGTVAMQRFSAAHEKEEVSGSSRASAGGQRKELSAGAEGKSGASFPLTAPTKLEVQHQGGGQPWAFLFSRAAIQLKEPINKGYRFKRTVSAVSQKKKGKWSVGDVYRVSLEVDASADMTWVAISDPIPAGASLLGSGLGGDSSSLTRGEQNKGAWPTYEERSFSGYRAYYQWLPKGTTSLQYTVRLNTPGRFQLPNTRVEALYAPEMYAEAGNGSVEVAE